MKTNKYVNDTILKLVGKFQPLLSEKENVKLWAYLSP